MSPNYEDTCLIPVKGRYSFLATPSRSALLAIQSPIEQVWGDISFGVTRPGLEATHSLSSNAKVMKQQFTILVTST
jgi:hypothetical protein